MSDPKPAAKAPAKTPEPPSREKFTAIGGKRMSLALAAIKRVGMLANPRAYAYTDSDVEKLETALHEAVNRCAARFKKPDEKAAEFNF